MLRKLAILSLLLSLSVAASFNITSTANFDAGTKANTTTITDRYNISAGSLELDFPYASKDAELISYWRMDNTLADSVGTIDLTNTGATGSATGGPYGDGYYNFVRGNSNYMTAQHSNLDFSTELTVALWFNRDDTTLSAMITKDVGQGGTLLLQRADANWYAQTKVNNGQGYNGNTEAGFGTGTWNQMVVTTSTAENRYETYLNGSTSYQGTIDSSGPYDTKTGAVNIGRDNRGNSYWNGGIAEVKWYNRSLSDNEVSALYNSGKKYKATGNWESAVQGFDFGKLLNTTIAYSNVDPGSYIDKIEWLVNGDVKANYTTDISSPSVLGDKALAGDSGLESYWALDGSGVDEKNSHNATASGTVSWPAGKFGQGANFSGDASSYLSTANIALNDSFTVSAWINAVEHSQYGVIYGDEQWYMNIYTGTDIGDYPRLEAYLSDGIVDTVVTGTTNISTGSWHHIAVVRNGTDIRLYLDGTLDGSGTRSEGLGQDAKYSLIGDDTYGEHFNGTVDDAAVFTRALSADEIQNIYSVGRKTIATPTGGSFDDVNQSFSIKVYLKGNGSKTPTVREISGNYHVNQPPTAPTLLSPADGSSINDTTPSFDWSDSTDVEGDPITYNLRVLPYMTGFNISSNTGFDAGTKLNTTTTTDRYNQSAGNAALDFPYAEKDGGLINYLRFENNLDDLVGNNVGTPYSAASYTTGKFGDAFNTSGGTNYIDYGTASFGETDSVTFSAWIYPTTTDQYQYIMASGGETSAEGIAMRFRGDTNTIFVGRTTLTDKYSVIGAGNVPLNQWTMLTGVYDNASGRMALYINGSYVADATGSSGTYSRLYNLTIGTNSRREPNSYPFHGRIDEVKIYNRVLNASEVAELYNDGLQYKTTGTWESTKQTLVGSLENTTIEYSGVDSNNYIDKIEWLVNDVVKANYTTDITSGTSTTITAPTGGSFSDVDGDFKVKIYFAGSGSSTPAITGISGGYNGSLSKMGIVGSAYTVQPSEELEYSKYYWKVQSYDGHNYSSWTGPWNFTVVTQSPYITRQQITPNYPTTSDNLNCSWVVSDVNENDVLKANVTWYKNGVHNATWDANSLSCANGETCYTTVAPTHNDTSFGDKWICAITAYDQTGLTDQENATATVLRRLVVWYTDGTYNDFDWQAEDWATPSANVESTFNGTCGGGSFGITATADFDAGTKANTTTITDRYNQTAGNVALDFPYAEKDGDLVSYWRFENNVNDEVGINNGGYGDVPYAAGKFGQALDFTGTDNHITIPNSASLNPVNYTQIFWFKTTTTVNQVVLEKGSQRYMVFSDDSACSGRFIAAAISTVGNRVCAPMELNDDVWHMMAITYKELTNLSMYIDGSLAASIVPNETNPSNTYNYTIGARYTGVAPFDGYVDDFALFNRTLTPSEIAERYNNGLQYKATGTWESAEQAITGTLVNTTIEYSGVDPSNYIDRVAFRKATNPNELENSYLRNDTGLVSYWRLEGNTNDETGMNDCTPYGGYTYVSDSKFGRGLLLNGTNGYANCGSDSSLDLNESVTITAWVKINATKWVNTIVNKGDQTQNKEMWLYRYDTDTANYWGWEQGNGTARGSARYYSTLVPQKWYFVAGTYDNGRAILYLDGVNVAEADTVNFINAPNYNLLLGVYTDTLNHFLNGTIDDVAIFNRSLTATEIADLYEGMKAKYEPNITSGTSTTITDSDLSAGSFSEVGDKFKVKLYLIGDGNNSPTLNEISGSYDGVEDRDVFYSTVNTDSAKVIDRIELNGQNKYQMTAVTLET